MMISLVFALVAILQTPLPTVEVKAPKDVAVVEAVNDAMGALSQKVTACVTAGAPVERCRCNYPRELAALRAKYDDLITRRPEWKDQLLSYQYVDKQGRNISGTLVVQNLRRQLDVLTCS